MAFIRVSDFIKVAALIRTKMIQRHANSFEEDGYIFVLHSNVNNCEADEQIKIRCVDF